MKRICGFAIGAALVALAAGNARAQDVGYDYDKGFDFSKAKTYAWVDGTILKDEFNHKRIVDAVDAQLAAKGLAKAAAGAAPDVAVAYHASFDKDLRIDGFSSGWGGYRFGASRYGSATVNDILIGTIVVDIMKDKAIVWRGTASKEVDVKASPEKREKNIQKGAEKLFKKYPPEAKK